MPALRAHQSGFDRHAQSPEDWQLRQLLNEIREACDDLELGVLERNSEVLNKRGPMTVFKLLSEARSRRDGYKASSRPDAGQSSSVLDEEGNPMPPVSDPTGEVVVARLEDPMRSQARIVQQSVRCAGDDLRTAVSLLANSQPRPEKSTGEPGCRSCERLGQWTPVHRVARCRWCYDWALNHAGDVPVDILRAHHEGRYITTAMVERAMQAMKPKPKTKPRSKRRKR